MSGPTDARSGAATRGLLITALVVALTSQSWLFDQVLQDDTYISFVYSRNFARGEGLVYNAGEPAVEGYTNFSWTLLTGLAMRLGLEAEWFTQVGAAVAAVGVLLMTRSVALALGATGPFAAAASLLLATKLPFATETMGGLETPLFALLVLAGLWPRLSEQRSRAGDLASGLFLALAALTRPEGVLVFVLLEGGELLLAGRRCCSGSHWRLVLCRAAPFAVLVGGHLIFRLSYYGDIVPNTFHAKVEPGPAQWGRGLEYVGRGIRYSGPVLFVLPYLQVLRSRSNALRLTLLLSTCYAAYVVFIGGDFKPTFRFLLVLLPLWAALGVTAVSRLTAARPWLGAIILLVLGGMCAVTSYRYIQPWIDLAGKAAEREAVGRHLHTALPEDAWLAVSNAGAIPYFADRRTIDMLGLSDRHIARQPAKEGLAEDLAGHQRGDGDYVLDRAPDAILFLRLDYTETALSAEERWLEIVQRLAFGTSEKEISRDPRFVERYELRSDPLPDGGWVNYFRKKGP